MTPTPSGIPLHAVPPSPRHPPVASPTRSTRLGQLARRVRAEGATALQSFWDEVAVHGTPLVEPLSTPDGDPPGEVAVSFLWRHRADVGAVLVVANKQFDRSDPAASAMSRVEGTDVWALTLRLPERWRGSYHLVPIPRSTGDWRSLHVGELMRWSIPDPLNRRRLAQPPGPDKSVAELPSAPHQRWRRPDPAVVPGQVTELAVDTPFGDRRWWVHHPDPYRPDRPHPLLVVLDGQHWVEDLALTTTLDNLVAAGRIPAMVSVLVDSGGADRRSVDLTCNPRFVQELTEVIVPEVAGRWNVTDRPERTIIAGQSLGGLAAAHAAWSAPERFGNVLSQSGSYWWSPDRRGEGQWLTRTMGRHPLPPVRFYVEVGTDERVNADANRHLADLVGRHGHLAAFHRFEGGHDRACWRGGIADGLMALARSW